jgi:peptide methionine sulfoxide reductase msrA/msrB
MKIFTGFILSNVLLFAKIQTIVFGAGCFWGVEKHFENLEGVIDVRVGYAGGDYDNPDYEKVLAHRRDRTVRNHAETVEVRYDDTRILTETLIKSFWQMHDPTQKNRQGNDVGNNYRSAIYYTTDEQKRIALATKKIYQKLLTKAGYGTITTEIKPLKKFYPAEEYHQDYLKKNPFGYCPNHATGVKFDEQKVDADSVMPLGGKEIIVVTAPHCPFCDRFKRDVLDKYRGTIPVRAAQAKQLKGFENLGKIIGTPTILFIRNGRIIASHTGYMDEKAFYKTLGALKLGKDSEAYDIAFNSATERRFCRKYEKFKNTGDGVFVDKISGEILFDTRDRFDSGSGWWSFYKAVDDAVVKKEDNSLGMHRIEVVAKKSGAHLGHVFNDAPGGKQRFCINANVLEFVPRGKLEE